MRPDACPRCGGLDRREIAPGDYECLTLATVGMVSPQASGLNVPAPVQRLCGYRYQVPVSSVTCHCGMYSIGRCAACGEPVCGLHATQTKGQLLCLDCNAANQKTAQEVARLEAVATITAWETEALKAVLLVSDPIDRALRVRHELGTKFFDHTLRELAETRVSQEQMVAWFIRLVPEPPRTRQVGRVGIFGWTSRRAVRPDVWDIGHTDRALPDTYSDQGYTSFSMAVMSVDGRVFVLQDGELNPLHAGESVNESEWFRAAQRPPLTIPKKPSWVLYDKTEAF
jgi:hypothetical protein